MGVVVPGSITPHVYSDRAHIHIHTERAHTRSLLSMCIFIIGLPINISTSRAPAISADQEVVVSLLLSLAISREELIYTSDRVHTS